MNFQNAIKTCIKKKYANFSGRASKSEFWFFLLFVLLGGVATTIIDIMMSSYSVSYFSFSNFFLTSYGWGPVNSIYQLLVILPSLAVSARRLHDTNRSGWWYLLIFLPIVGVIILIIWWATKGEKKKNKFGNPIKLKGKRKR